MQTSVLGNYFKLKTTLGIISWKFLGLKLRYISQKFKGSLLRSGSGSNLFMTGWTLNWTLGLVQQKFWTLNWTLSSVQEVQVRTLVQNQTSATLAPATLLPRQVLAPLSQGIKHKQSELITVEKVSTVPKNKRCKYDNVIDQVNDTIQLHSGPVGMKWSETAACTIQSSWYYLIYGNVTTNNGTLHLNSWGMNFVPSSLRSFKDTVGSRCLLKLDAMSFAGS